MKRFWLIICIPIIILSALFTGACSHQSQLLSTHSYTNPVKTDSSLPLFSCSEENPLNIHLAASDPDNDCLIYTIVDPPVNGTLSGTAPDLTYTPNPDFYGLDSFSFKVNDGYQDSNVATVSITVSPVNDAPVAVDDSITTTEGTELTFGVLDNDTDVEGDALFISQVGNGDHGLAAKSGNRAITYTSNNGYSGEDTISYEVSDGKGGKDTATVFVTIQPAVVIADIQDANVTIEISKKSFWKWWRVSAKVTITESGANGKALTDATVHGHWSGVYSESVSGTTNRRGNITFKTPWVTASGTIQFTIDGISKNGVDYQVGGEIVSSISGSIKKGK